MTTPLSSTIFALSLRFNGLALLFLSTFFVNQFILVNDLKIENRLITLISLYATPSNPSLITFLLQHLCFSLNFLHYFEQIYDPSAFAYRHLLRLVYFANFVNTGELKALNLARVLLYVQFLGFWLGHCQAKALKIQVHWLNRVSF